jgi:hypothetical protein
MDSGILNGSHFSADVRMHLRLNGHVLPIAQLGPDFLVLKEPLDHPPADAEIDMSIDGQESRWPVYLAEGLVANRRKARIAQVRGRGENGPPSSRINTE